MLLLALALLGAPNLPTVHCDPDEPSICTSAVERGTPAPFSGTLYTPQAASEATVALEQAEARLTLAVTATAAIWRIRYEGAVQLGEDRVGLRDREIDRLGVQVREQAVELRELRDPPFYERPAFLVIGSVLLTATAIVVPIVAIETSRP